MTGIDGIAFNSPTLPRGLVDGLRVTAMEALRKTSPVFVEGEVHYATFGLKYAQEPHPTLGLADPNSSIRLEGFNAETARAIVWAVTGGMFAFMYPSATFNTDYHPRPPILDVIAL